ncbi:NDP-hexose 2,3-dehydratase family protein [Amycolatopsis sp. DG1A-15b]|uniref:NDP-hexose 2,3-dehydratase family protein n=1 Tax=Amycolatopsis sp. DG1A-15b TaxID=3052846 RepID=UPI00255BA35B|nr:NDP-hexose 2,3-dehydratase family protein [Amycolatopsis sp. DG1A-15b]WIX90473.1 NDP-hexose 2,3-dehydratase family protein [Amycolatopsis sp. DG1A-15b]
MTERAITAPPQVSRRIPLPGTTSGGPDAVLSTLEDFERWWAERHRAGRFEVDRVPLTELDAWHFDPGTGNLGHESGRFFTVEGLQVRFGGVVERSQPVIHQHEIGVLGILVKEIDGVPHCLMQAKMEPGNVNVLQLSPTVQATRSNYTQVHRGAQTRYLEYFTGLARGEVLVDVLQSEQGAWFWRKRNRNLVVKVGGEVPVAPDFRWLPLPLVHRLLRIDNLVNMDARTVLACLPPAGTAGAPGTARHPTADILSWFTEAKTRCDWHARLVPLAEVGGWAVTGGEIVDDERRQFRITGVRVTAGNREVTRWTQPLLEPRGQGLAVFVTKLIDGVRHVLVQARPEIGLLDLVEIGPTIQLSPGEDAGGIEDPLVREVARGRLGRTRFSAVLSEEGGRFFHALTRYRVVEVGEEFGTEPSPDYCWVADWQLTELLRHGHYVNIEARSLLACLRSLPY